MNSPEYQTLSAAFTAAGLSDLLNSNSPFTLFAPSEEALKKWSGENLSLLMKPENRKELRTMLTYHMIAGRFTAARILRAMCRGAGTAVLTTIQGDEILASMQGTDILLTDCSGHTARIIVADTSQGNGVIHEIDRVIAPR